TVRRTTSFRNDRPFPAADFQLVALRILEEKCIVPSTVTATDFRTADSVAARLTHQLRKPIHLLPRIRPERDACAVRFMILIPSKAKKFRRLVATGGVKRV